MRPEPMPSFVVLLKNQFNKEEAKYEHTGNDIGKN
jgi:hypothetical protein